MNHSNIAKFFVALMILAAVALGILQRESLFGSNTTVKSFASDDSLESYYNRGQQLAKENDANSQATFLAVGDIMLSRNVAANTKLSGNNALPFSKLNNTFNSVDFSFGNLETPVAKTGGTIGGHSLVFNSPQEYVKELVNAKFKVVNLANNHAFDKGLEGLKYTAEFLDTLNIKHIGTGMSLTDAWTPAIVEQNGIKICFIGASYASINDNGKTINDYVARIEDIENLKLKIENSKSLCDFVVATMHAGTEYTRKPNQAQIDFAHNAIDYGADIVIGAHPHWVQTTEKYKDKYIFYSLGNFIFDQEFSQDTKEGLTLKITISKKGNCHPERSEGSLPMNNESDSSNALGMECRAKIEQIELLPVIIENYSTPRLATNSEAKKILQKIDLTENILK